MKPSIVKGGVFSDSRGTLKFNNEFNASQVKRIYTIQNFNNSITRAWQGHKIEQRWFSAIRGKFIIKLIKVDNWEEPSKDLKELQFVLDADTLDYLHVPPGYISSIKSEEEQSVLLVLADYILGEIDDEFRFPIDYFQKK